MTVLFKEGTPVWNEKKGIGTISLSSDEEILVEFDSGEEEVFPLAGKKPPLTPLSTEGFWLRKKNDSSALSEIVKKDPIETIMILIADEFTSFTPKFLKDAVSPDIIPAEEWETWHKNAVEAAKNDPRFEVSSDKKITFQGDMVQLTEDLMLSFRKARSIKEKQKVCKEMLKMESKGVPVDDVKEAAIIFFSGATANKTNNLGARLEALFFLEELDKDEYEALKEELFSEIAAMDSEKAAEAVAIISDAVVRKNLMEVIREKKSDSFIEICIQLCKRFKKTQRDWTLDYLLSLDDKTPLKTILDKTVADIATNLQPFVWLAKTTISSPEKVASIGHAPTDTIPAMFKIFSNIYVTSAFSARPKDDRSVSKEEDEIQKLLKDFKKIISFLKKQPEEMVRKFATLYASSNAIPNEIRESFIKGPFAESFPGMNIVSDYVYGEDEVVVTRESFDKFKTEYDDIVNFKLDEATKAIQTAREWGDISENAELNIAQETQRKLLLRKNELQNILDNCRVIE